ncbi:MAG TPA: hypothetical protein VFO44_11865 [Steroidobacteraceae bacterium]|nr:hypothetical protein [Steroidobacteraceae bacterium]
MLTGWTRPHLGAYDPPVVIDESIEESCGRISAGPGALTRAQLARIIRSHARSDLYDKSPGSAAGTALYTLSDPGDLVVVRYVGQTRAPKRRFLQHLNCARLWVPDEVPWWVKSPRLRPLYAWIRELYRDSGRLPTMIVRAWLQTGSEVRAAERGRICECLAQRMPLLNYEAEILERQLRLL